jgi:hypothetical protein
MKTLYKVFICSLCFVGLESVAQIEGIIPQKNQTEPLSFVKTFSKQFNPKSDSTHRVPALPMLTEDERNQLILAFKKDKKISGRCLTLMMLKLYYSHIKCCNQSYMLSAGETTIDSVKQPILYRYLNYSGQYKPEVIYELTSRVAYDWVQKHPDEESFKPIKKEMGNIKKLLRERNLNDAK